MTPDDRPFVVFSSLTQDWGHLLRDDRFWYRILGGYDERTRVITSPASVANLAELYPQRADRFEAFRDLPWLYRLSSRAFFIWRMLRVPRIEHSRVVLQAFDEIAILFFFWRVNGSGNELALVLTNNISPERIDRSRWILRLLMRTIFRRVDRVFYHSEFEHQLIRTLLQDPSLEGRYAYLKYHLPGDGPGADGCPRPAVISFFGPVLESKPVEPFLELIEADEEGQYQYRFYNVGTAMERQVQARFEGRRRFAFHSVYLSEGAYLNAIRAPKFVFLPHNRLYEGKISGIMSDCIAQGTPFIADRVEPVPELFDRYGPMGLLLSFEQPGWPVAVLKCASEQYVAFQTSLRRCREDHSAEQILDDFLTAMDASLRRP